MFNDEFTRVIEALIAENPDGFDSHKVIGQFFKENQLAYIGYLSGNLRGQNTVKDAHFQFGRTIARICEGLGYVEAGTPHSSMNIFGNVGACALYTPKPA